MPRIQNPNLLPLIALLATVSMPLPSLKAENERGVQQPSPHSDVSSGTTFLVHPGSAPLDPQLIDLCPSPFGPDDQCPMVDPCVPCIGNHDGNFVPVDHSAAVAAPGLVDVAGLAVRIGMTGGTGGPEWETNSRAISITGMNSA